MDYQTKVGLVVLGTAVFFAVSLGVTFAVCAIREYMRDRKNANEKR
jgi:hypothetical protein